MEIQTGNVWPRGYYQQMHEHSLGITPVPCPTLILVIPGNSPNFPMTPIVEAKTISPRKAFPCNICNKSFGYKHVLVNHERCHSGEKPFECTICTRKFRRSHHLEVHKRLHSGEKPYECSHCGKKFRQPGNLKSHIRVHRIRDYPKRLLSKPGQVKVEDVRTAVEENILKLHGPMSRHVHNNPMIERHPLFPLQVQPGNAASFQTSPLDLSKKTVKQESDMAYW